MMQMQAKTFKDIAQMQTQVPNTIYVNAPVTKTTERIVQQKIPVPTKNGKPKKRKKKRKNGDKEMMVTLSRLSVGTDKDREMGLMNRTNRSRFSANLQNKTIYSEDEQEEVTYTTHYM